MSTQQPAGGGSVDGTLVESPITDEPAEPNGKKSPAGRIVGGILGGILILLAGAYVVGYLMAGDNLPKNAEIAGVAVGGLNRDEAIEKLTAELKDAATGPMPITIVGEEGEISPADAGLTVDYALSVDQAGAGKSLDPRHILKVLTGGQSTEAVVVTDTAMLETAVADLAKEYDRPAADGELAYEGKEVLTTPAVDGVTLDQAAAAESLTLVYLQPSAVVDLAAAVTAPEVTTEEVNKVADEFAEPAVSGLVTVKAGQAGQFQISPTMIGKSITFEPKDGTLAPVIDAKKLHSVAAKEIATVELTEPKDATFKIKGGKPVVVPAVNGTEVSAENLVKAIEPALTKSGSERTVDVELAGAKAKFSTEDAKKAGVKEVTGKFTTYYDHAASNYRNINIGLAASFINGTVLEPGETFSYNDIVGERTYERGFVDGGVIAGSRLELEVGGGVSQGATTTYNAMFFAGLKDIEHHAHSLYYSKYPAGREATVYWGSLDLRFQNDSPYAVYVQAFIDESTPNQQGSLTVRMWSTEVYEIKAPDATRTNFTSGTTQYDPKPGCYANSATPGFKASYYRAFIKDGKEVKRENFSHVYDPGNNIICGKDPNDKKKD